MAIRHSACHAGLSSLAVLIMTACFQRCALPNEPIRTQVSPEDVSILRLLDNVRFGYENDIEHVRRTLRSFSDRALRRADYVATPDVRHLVAREIIARYPDDFDGYVEAAHHESAAVREYASYRLGSEEIDFRRLLATYSTADGVVLGCLHEAIRQRLGNISRLREVQADLGGGPHEQYDAANVELARLLSSFETDSELAQLKKALHSPWEPVRVLSVTRLASHLTGNDGPAVLDALLTTLESSTETTDVRRAAALALRTGVGYEPHRARTTAALLAAIENEDLASAALDTLRWGCPLLPDYANTVLRTSKSRLLRLSQSTAYANRAAAAEAMSAFEDGPADVVARLSQLVDDPSGRVSYHAAFSLAAMGNHGALALCEFLRSQDHPRRIVILETLCLKGVLPPDVAEDIEPLLGDEDFRVRELAVHALRKVKPLPQRVLCGALRDDSAAVRVAAARAIGDADTITPDVATILSTLLSDKNADVREAATVTLRKHDLLGEKREQ